MPVSCTSSSLFPFLSQAHLVLPLLTTFTYHKMHLLKRSSLKHSKSTVSSRLITQPSTHSYRGRETIFSARPDLILSSDHDHKMAHGHYNTRNLHHLYWVIVYDLLLDFRFALLPLKVCPGFLIPYILLYIQLYLFPPCTR